MHQADAGQDSSLALSLEAMKGHRQHTRTRLRVLGLPLLFSGLSSSCWSFCVPPQRTRLWSSLSTLDRLRLRDNNDKSISFNDFDVDDLWQASMGVALNPYRSKLLDEPEQWHDFLTELDKTGHHGDPFWAQIRLEAAEDVKTQPEAGPQLYQGILSQPNLLTAIVTVISHEIETELIPATALKNLFLELLTEEDEFHIRLDLQAVAERSPSAGSAMDALLFHNGFHALVCYRVGHRLWQAGRTALAYYMQSAVSRKYSADIHPACQMGSGVYLRVGGGVVIGETAKVGDDVSILEGVTLGGTGKEAGDRHPKIGNGVIIQDGGTVLGNIVVGDGAVIVAKSIVTKPTPPLSVMSGVPARIQGYRTLEEREMEDDLQRHLAIKYLDHWKKLADDMDRERQEAAENKS